MIIDLIFYFKKFLCYVVANSGFYHIYFFMIKLNRVYDYFFREMFLKKLIFLFVLNFKFFFYVSKLL
jgi:hypothetical protein